MSVCVRGGKFSGGSVGGKLSQRVEYFESEVDKQDGIKDSSHLQDTVYFRMSLSSNRKP